MHAQPDDRVEPIGPEQRRVPRHRRAPVVPDDRCAFDAEGVEHPDDVADEVELGVLVDPARHVGLAVAALVGRDRVVPGVAEGAELVPPRVPAFREAMTQHDGAPVGGPGLGHVHPDPVGVDEAMAQVDRCGGSGRAHGRVDRSRAGGAIMRSDGTTIR